MQYLVFGIYFTKYIFFQTYLLFVAGKKHTIMVVNWICTYRTEEFEICDIITFHNPGLFVVKSTSYIEKDIQHCLCKANLKNRLWQNLTREDLSKQQY